MTKCKCNQGFTALGLPDCQLYPSIPVRLYFTTNAEPLVAGGGNGVLLYGSTPYAYQNDPSSVPSGYEYYRDTYKLAAPYINEAGGERADAITEEVGGTPFFVREGDRTIQATFVGKQAELVRFVSELRCAQNLGLFIVDDNGVVWGARTWDTRTIAKPIPVQNATLQSRMDFPTASTVQKVRLSFVLGRGFSDGDFVPVATAETYAQLGLPDPREYNPPKHVEGLASVFGGNILLLVYANFGTGNAPYALRPVQLPQTTLTAFDANGSALGTVSFTPIVLPNGFPAYQAPAPLPTGTAYLAYTQTDLTTITYNGYDWLSFRAKV